MQRSERPGLVALSCSKDRRRIPGRGSGDGTSRALGEGTVCFQDNKCLLMGCGLHRDLMPDRVVCIDCVAAKACHGAEELGWGCRMVPSSKHPHFQVVTGQVSRAGGALPPRLTALTLGPGRGCPSPHPACPSAPPPAPWLGSGWAGGLPAGLSLLMNKLPSLLAVWTGLWGDQGS